MEGKLSKPNMRYFYRHLRSPESQMVVLAQNWSYDEMWPTLCLRGVLPPVAGVNLHAWESTSTRRRKGGRTRQETVAMRKGRYKKKLIKTSTGTKVRKGGAPFTAWIRLDICTCDTPSQTNSSIATLLRNLHRADNQASSKNLSSENRKL